VTPYTVSPYLRMLPIEPVREDLAWMDLARCTEVDPEAWFPEKGGSTRPAKRVCLLSCEVRAECLEYALEHEAVAAYGIWGGMSERERRRLKQQRAASSTPQSRKAVALCVT